MSIKHEELLKIIEKAAPPELAESWDNCGMQLDFGKTEYGRILVALEINEKVIDEAVKKKADFIITHHPLIFGKLSSVDINDVTGKHVIRLIREGIPVYSAHTSFDSAPAGNNAYLAKLLGLSDVKGLVEDGCELKIALEGKLPREIPFSQLPFFLKERLGLEEGELRISGNPDSVVTKAGFCTGSGCEFMKTAAENGCDLYITGDVKYHDAQNALGMGIVLADAGHFGTEKFFGENFGEQIKDMIKEKAEVMISEVNLYPFSVVV
ncbi:MAG: Nif3-like dinuclear metal center hexameric protein [Clostridia bacterium]|nr:Nif3-like dinuclear metal center hexameric protein [Clostridia bacterium]